MFSARLYVLLLKKEDQLWLLALICSRICHWFGGRIGLWAIFFSARHWIIATVLFSASHQIFLSVSLCHFLAISRQTSIFFMASYFKSFKTWGSYNHYRPSRIRLKSCENNLEYKARRTVFFSWRFTYHLTID